jgi:hypothetical protein
MHLYGPCFHKKAITRSCSLILFRYTESIVLFKFPQDAPWHASALEGLATVAVIEAWLTGHGLVSAKLNKLVHTVLTEGLGRLFQ